MRKIKDIIREYRQIRRQYPDPWVEDCKGASLRDALVMAATARDKHGRKHPHQNILKNDVLNAFAKRVVRKINRFQSARTFQDIYDIVEACAAEGIASLTIYDTAHRIGKNKSIRIDPDDVYIHRGTKTGAVRFLGRKVPEKKLNRNVFKGLSKLSGEEIEDILCIYKDDLFKAKCVRVEHLKKHQSGIC